MTRGGGKLRSVIMEKKNKIFKEDIEPLFGSIDLCPGRISPWNLINPIHSFC